MHLPINEPEYLRPEVLALPSREDALPRFQAFCLKFLESSFFEMCSMALISLYTVWVLFQLTMASILNVTDEFMQMVDRIFLTVFFAEIVMKTFASNLMFLSDAFNLFDAVIVIVSNVLNLMNIEAKGLGVLRLLRVVVITIRKITGNTSKLRHQSKMNNPVESVINILKSIVASNEI